MTLFAALFVAGCSGDEGDEEDSASGASAAADTGTAAEGQSGEASIQQQFELSMTFTSPVFNAKRRIPKTHTCIGGTVDKPGAYFARSNLTPTDAQNLSPPLAWTGAPEGTQSFALVMRSTELLASDETWVHWVMWNIPADVTELAEGVEELETLENSARQGLNSGGVPGYLGPCPPDMLSVYKPSDAKGNENPKQEIEKYRFEIYALDTVLDLPAGATREELLKAMDGHILGAGVLIGERQGKLIMRATG
jgi:Raf kinase inhibitor-like YbhB/YbcL family protein